MLGLMGSGKSTVLQAFRALGCPVVDADACARRAVDASTPEGRAVVQQIAARFGDDVLAADGISLDRVQMRKKMASSVQARNTLEELLHPHILRLLEDEVQSWRQRGAPLGFVEGSRLVESGYAQRLQGCILITAPETVRLARVMARDQVSPDEALAVFRLQSETALRGVASEVWDNVITPEDLRRRAEAFVKKHGGKTV